MIPSHNASHISHSKIESPFSEASWTFQYNSPMISYILVCLKWNLLHLFWFSPIWHTFSVHSFLISRFTLIWGRKNINTNKDKHFWLDTNIIQCNGSDQSGFWVIFLLRKFTVLQMIVFVIWFVSEFSEWGMILFLAIYKAKQCLAHVNYSLIKILCPSKVKAYK